MQEDDIDEEDILFDQALLRVDEDADCDDTPDDQALLINDYRPGRPLPQVRKSPRRILQTTCLILAFFGLVCYYAHIIDCLLFSYDLLCCSEI